MDKHQLCNDSLMLLGRFLKEVSPPPSEEQTGEHFIYLHAQNILNISHDLLFLDNNQRFHSTYILIRPMYESLFNLVAAVKNPAFATEKIIAEAEYNKDKFEKVIKDDGASKDHPLRETVSYLTSNIQACRQQYAVESKHRWDTLSVAKEAKLDHHYVREYCIFSQNIHASMCGIKSQENQCGRQTILRSVIYIILATVGHAAQILKTTNPQSYIDESAKLLSELNMMVKRGDLREGS